MVEESYPKPAEVDASWLGWNDAFLRLLNRDSRRAAAVIEGAWQLLPESYRAIPAESPATHTPQRVADVPDQAR